MSVTVARHHWLNTVVGILDTTFFLTDEERFAVSQIIRQLLERLAIPERGVPDALPIPLAQEAACGYYAIALAGPSESGVVRPVRMVTEFDAVVPLETWRDALVSMFTTAYPRMAGEEKVILTKVFNDLLAAIGAPRRAAAYLPEMVMATQMEVENRA